MDILMEAGRLAAEYLVSKGVISPELLPAKFHNGSPPGFERQAREAPPVAEGRTSALARLGQRFPDDDRFGSGRRGRSRRRAGPYGSIYDSEWGRESGKPRHWIDRRRSFSDLAEEEDESAPGFGMNRRSGYGGIRSSVSRVSSDEPPTRSESVSEKEKCELADDTGSKASSSSTRKDPQPDADEGTSRVVDEVRGSSSDITEEVKSERTDELKKKEALEEDIDTKPSCADDGDVEMKECNDKELDCKPCIDEGDIEMKDCNDLLKLYRFAKVPTKLRSSLANKSPEVHHDGPVVENCSVDETASVEEANDINSNEIKGSELEASENHSLQSDKSMDEAEESLKMKQNDCFEHDIVDSRNNESCPSMLSEIQQSQSSHYDGKVAQDEEMIKVTDRQGSGSSDFIPMTKDESPVMAEEEQHQSFTTFRICDLNLTGSPEMSEIPMGPVGHCSSSVRRLEKDKGVSADFSLSKTNGVNDACNNNQFFLHNKVVPVIDLEENSPEQISDLDLSKDKNGMPYPSLESIINQGTHTDSLPVIQDGYNLVFPEFMGTDVSGCPSAPADINNLHTGMGINGAEGYPSIDDHIYVSLEEIPMGFMGVWDQPSQDYEKFF